MNPSIESFGIRTPVSESSEDVGSWPGGSLESGKLVDCSYGGWGRDVFWTGREVAPARRGEVPVFVLETEASEEISLSSLPITNGLRGVVGFRLGRTG